MKYAEKIRIGVALTTVVSIVLGLLAFSMAHASWLAVAFFIPFAVLQGLAFHSDLLFWWLAIGQFPLYGLFITWAWLHEKVKVVAVIVTIVHFVGLGACLPAFKAQNGFECCRLPSSPAFSVAESVPITLNGLLGRTAASAVPFGASPNGWRLAFCSRKSRTPNRLFQRAGRPLGQPTLLSYPYLNSCSFHASV